MRTRNFPTALFAGLFLLGTATTVAAQTDAQEHVAHHPAETQASPSAPAMPVDAPAAAAPRAMLGMGMMTPEMMQRMMGGMAGQEMPDGGAGPNMASQTRVAGMMMCPIMQMMMSGQAGTGMPGMSGGQGILLGTPLGAPKEMTEGRVRAIMEQQLIGLGNPRLRLGEIGSEVMGASPRR